MTEAELEVARWFLDGASVLQLPPYFFRVTLKPHRKAAMLIKIDPQYLTAEVFVDPKAAFTKGDYLARLYLAHELAHLFFHVTGATFDDAQEEKACDWFAAVAAPRMPSPPDSIVETAMGLMS